MQFNIKKVNTSLIVGAGHGIGLAFVERLLNNDNSSLVLATYRDEKKALHLFELQSRHSQRLSIYKIDPTNENEIIQLAKACDHDDLKFNLIINSVGLLHSNTIQPEKSIHRFDPANFLEIMRVNAIVTPLLGKHFLQRFNADTITAFLSISAKVGSIDDNKMGGWHSYRASKAALNMLVKNLAIECKRKYKNCIVLAIHPGTTKTDLSSPFIDRTAYKVHTPFETAENIMNILKSTTLNDTGSFYSWNGSKISW